MTGDKAGGDWLNEHEIGIGNWSWGDLYFWGDRARYSVADSRAAFETSLAAGITLIDTAEVYGPWRAERLLGQFMRESGHKVTIATKFMPLPYRLGKGSLRRALKGSLRRLGVERVQLYQMHWPSGPVAIETWMDAMAGAVEEGLIGAVGVSNYDVSQMRRAAEALDRRGVRLASNQVEYSLAQRNPEFDGLRAACAELGVKLIAYSPLSKGLLTGKYTPESPPPGLRRRALAGRLGAVQPLVGLLKEIGQAHGGKTPGQVALNWTICKGTLPIPGARNARQAAENAGAVGWRLAEAELAALDESSARIREV